MMAGNSFFEIKNINKTFPGVKALMDICLSVERGEVRALVGENGAGKSTLMKILNGNYRMDSGEIKIDGEIVHISSPVDAAKLGISIIFQELNVINGLSVAENIYMGRLSDNGKLLVDWRTIHEKTKELFKRINFNLNPAIEVGNLSVAKKQMVEIAKALSYDVKIILMDEPSASLTKSELDSLFKIIRDLKEKDIAVIYISHRMEEIFEVCDSITIIRDGCLIHTGSIDSLSRDEIVKKMVGREVTSAYPKRVNAIGEVVLDVRNLRRKGFNTPINFSLRKGEVLGIAGLVGAGRTETMRALYGVDYKESGEIEIDGKIVTIRCPNDAKAAGIAFITEDRKSEGLVIDLMVKTNIVMANLGKTLFCFFTSAKKEIKVCDEYVEKLRIKTSSNTQVVENLSGGNQQKIVVAKWLNTDARIILMDEPTRGIDVGAKYEIYQLINGFVENGGSVILISSELPEVIGLSDRVLVMKNDAIVAELRGEDITVLDAIRYAL